MASGINLTDLTGNPAIALLQNAEEGGAGSGNCDDRSYTIDAGQLGGLGPDDSINFVPLTEMPATFTDCHILTEAHDEILANGTPVGTFVDYVNHKCLDNYGEYVALYGCDRLIPEMKHVRISSRRQLPQALLEQRGITTPVTESASADPDRFMARTSRAA